MPVKKDEVKPVKPEKKKLGRPLQNKKDESNKVELDSETSLFFKWLGRGDIALGAKKAANYIFSIEWNKIGDIRDGPYNKNK